MTSPIQSYLAGLHARFAGLDDGQVATYIPELAKADPSLFAIVVATVDGQVYEVGDSRVPFTIQSVSKPLAYGLALQDCGAQAVGQRVGVEPSGEAFNSISLEPSTGRPLNPMINAGAIAISSMLAAAHGGDALAQLLAVTSAYAGRPLQIDTAVFESERATGHRNRAIGHLLRNYEIIGSDPEPALDLYFQQCAVQVHARDLALTAATLANGGVNPVTGQRAVDEQHVGAILSLMTTCGVYDFSGEWVLRVGMPAKSGVGGGIMAVLPGQLGIAVFSPALDAQGNSARGVRAFELLSTELGLHFLRPPRAAASTIRARYTLKAVRSKRQRRAAERAMLDLHGDRAAVFELQGDLRLSTLEPVMRAITEPSAGLDLAVLDFKRVSHADPTAVRMLAQLLACCAARGQQLVFTRVRRGELLAGLGEELDPRFARALNLQPQLDLGLEWCERALLQQHPPAVTDDGACALAGHRLCDGLGAAELELLSARIEQQELEPGTLIVRQGEPARALYLLLRGEVSVTVDLPQGGHRRLSTLTAGMLFGEAALLHSGLRTADVRADTSVRCGTLSLEAFAQLEADYPALCVRLMRNVLRQASGTIAHLTGEVAALEA